MPQIYRMLTGDDTADFCHKVSLALSRGWALHGSPAMAFDPVAGKMRCGQAVTKDIEIPYSPEMKLGQQ